MTTPGWIPGCGLDFDLRTGDVRVNGREVVLTAKEYAALSLLYRANGGRVTKVELALAVWPEWADEVNRNRGLDLSMDASVDNLVLRLRRKLEEQPSQPRFLLSERGRGYRLRGDSLTTRAPAVTQAGAAATFQELWGRASPSADVWPISAEQIPGRLDDAIRGLGAPRENVQHRYRLGSSICLAIRMTSPGYLTLLDQGPEGTVYCLCPSRFAPDIRLPQGISLLPQAISRHRAFVASGAPGRERLLAIVSAQPLGLDWMPRDLDVPAVTIDEQGLRVLHERLDTLPDGQWVAWTTYFDIIA